MGEVNNEIMRNSFVNDDSTPFIVTYDVTVPNTTEIVTAADVLNTFVPWVLIVGGSICNVFIVLGMRTRSFRDLSTSVYMTAMAVNDLCSLVILLIPHWLHLNFPDSIHRSSVGAHGLCKFFNFYGWGQADLGIMLTSAMTLDRAHVILRPMTRVDLVKRAKIVIVVCVCITIVKEFHFLFSSEMVPKERKDRLCDVAFISNDYYEFYTKYWPWLDAIFVTTCFVIMISSNGVIIAFVRKQRKGRVFSLNKDDNFGGSVTSVVQISGGGGGRGGGGGANRQIVRTSSTMTIHAASNYETVANQVARMLIAETFTFIVLSYPFSFHLIVVSQMDDLHLDPDKVKANALAFNVVLYLLFANKCVNFLVYCLAGTRFRKAIVQEVLCHRRCRRFFRGDQVLSFDSDTSLRSRAQRLEVDRAKPEMAREAGQSSRSQRVEPERVQRSNAERERLHTDLQGLRPVPRVEQPPSERMLAAPESRQQNEGTVARQSSKEDSSSQEESRSQDEESGSRSQPNQEIEESRPGLTDLHKEKFTEHETVCAAVPLAFINKLSQQ